jgi:hypothetical protein
MRKACIASLTRYSRSTGPSAARPSPLRENGVLPEPFNCSSRRTPVRSRTRPAGWLGRRPVGAQNDRTDGPRTPSLWVRHPAVTCCPKRVLPASSSRPVQVQTQIGRQSLIDLDQAWLGQAWARAVRRNAPVDGRSCLKYLLLASPEVALSKKDWSWRILQLRRSTAFGRQRSVKHHARE